MPSLPHSRRARLSLQTLEDRTTPAIANIAVGADFGGTSTVAVYNETGALVRSFSAEAVNFKGGIRVAMGDINNDTFPEVFTAPGRGGSPFVRIFDGQTFAEIRRIQVYGITFTNGVNIAVGNVTGDNTPELLVAPDVGGAPFVNVFNTITGQYIRQFQVYGRTFTNGVRVTTADVAGNAAKEVVVAPMAGGLPAVNAIDYATGFRVLQFYAYETSYTSGFNIAGGRINTNARDAIVVGSGPNRSTTLRVFNGANGQLLGEFPPFLTSSFTGATVALADLNNDGLADYVAGSGPGGPETVTARRSSDGAAVLNFNPFLVSANNSGVFVAAAKIAFNG